MSIHPVIQFCCFFIFVSGLALSEWHFAVPTGVIVIILYTHYGQLRHLQRSLSRLRWFFLSLFVLYAWFNQPDWHWLPTSAGVLLALQRISALILIVIAAHLLLSINSSAQLIATIQWYLRPLQWLGVPTERLAVRLILVLDTIQHVQDLYPNTIKPLNSTDTHKMRYFAQKIDMINQQFMQLFMQVLQQAERVPLQVIEIPHLHAPPWWQWGYPLLLIALWQGGQ